MNLADAIRQAALGQRKLQKQPPPPPIEPEEDNAVDAEEITPVLQLQDSTEQPTLDDDELAIDPEMLSAAAAAAAAAAAQFDQGSGYPEPMSAQIPQNAVRLELFLTPEQMNLMLRAVMTSHHSVMTLREAAAYLRMTTGTLERMAQDHEVPAFVIDGRWRFPKPALDEWLAIRALKGDRDVA
ncbi:MAG: helix-turn-helix domain-containing protein [Fimbriimonadaceae bacterium]|nr:helix-turn-helix domain-containing protein [Fimbriimonadaceae bacterium]